MGKPSSETRDCYCAYCRGPGRVYIKKHITPTNVVMSAVCSLFAMVTIWQTFDPKVFVIFVFCLSFAEVFVQFRWRLSVICKHCGFDPILYMKAPELAKAKVSRVFKERNHDSNIFFTPSPVLRSALRSLSKSRREELSLEDLESLTEESIQLSDRQLGKDGKSMYKQEEII